VKHEDKCFPRFIHKTILISLPEIAFYSHMRILLMTRHSQINDRIIHFISCHTKTLFRRVRLTIALVPKAVIDTEFMERETTSSSSGFLPKDRIERRNSLV